MSRRVIHAAGKWLECAPQPDAPEIFRQQVQVIVTGIGRQDLVGVTPRLLVNDWRAIYYAYSAASSRRESLGP